MAGPATNVATLGAVYRALGRRALAIYLGTIVAGSLAAAWLFDFVLAGGSAMAHVHGEHGTPLEVVTAVLLIGLLAWFAVDELHTWLGTRRQADPDTAQIELSVEGMTCGGCANKLRKALLAEDGVQSTEVDHEAGRALVRGSVDEPRIRAVVARAGFRPV